MHIRSWAVIAALLIISAVPASAQDAKLLERGTYLMNSIVACGNCHVQRDKDGRPIVALGLSGGEVFDEKPFKAYAPNITPDPETGIGKWTEAQLVSAIREGIRPDGTLIGPPMPIGFYRGISDDDARRTGRLPARAAAGEERRAEVRLPDQAAAGVRAADQEKTSSRRRALTWSSTVPISPGRSATAWTATRRGRRKAPT